MPKTGHFILTCNVLTKKEEYIPFEYPRIKHIYAESSIIKDNKKSVNKPKREYYKRVWDITLANNLIELMQGYERGFKKHHIDHITPISYGFKFGIPPEQIGHISNLRPLYYKDNMLKSFKVNQKIKEQIRLL